MRLTQDEIQDNKGRLSAWLTPAEASRRAEQLMHRLGDDDFFNQPGVGFVREIWVAAKFGTARAASSVRLINDARPDVALRFSDSREEIYELVEADALGRRRGRDYKDIALTRNRKGDGPVDAWATPEQAFAVIHAAAARKAQKASDLWNARTPYPQGTGLLVYLNISDYGTHQRGIEGAFGTAVEPARKWFSPIWILWKALAYHVCETPAAVN